MKTVASFFRFDHYRTSFRKETVAGITTFLTMAYIIIVNPAILEAGGIPRGPQTTATILAAVFGCVVMALWANRPFAIAPYMSENAFVAFTVVKTLGYTWQTAMGAVFVAGIVFSILTVFRVRSWLAEAIPLSLKCAFAVGIGLFLTFIGLNETGLVTLGVAGAPVKMGNIAAPSVLLAVFGYLLTVFLMTRRVRGAIVIGIVATTTLSIAFGVTPMPKEFVSLPPDISPILFQLDIGSVFDLRFFPVVLTIFIMAFLDTVGTLIGLSMRADLLDENGNLPEIEKPMLADALATTVAPLLGTTTTGAYIESAAGIEEGGRTGFTALVVAGLFLLALFFAPLFTIVPSHAYGIALIVIGSFMIEPVKRIAFDDFTELVPAFLTIVLMIFTYNIGVGMSTGLLTYPLLKAAAGRGREVPAGMWVLALLAVSLFVFFPKM
ncbi:NCS2 family permease [Geobacter hydrogenophilus]|uniref:Permease n=1 Tax=Geobacter hydrogenophilus TaxID=40983 RepID=A0A9W6G469_9BACT|nr:NCS2 family permease [Geobacter hydrogenophilus]MBT0892640.1 NCS2 family permease [Geobacter hydrogenophilus]GLI40038.1 permease [Geobacter hydrogenophilus]